MSYCLKLEKKSIRKSNATVVLSFLYMIAITECGIHFSEFNYSDER